MVLRSLPGIHQPHHPSMVTSYNRQFTYCTCKGIATPFWSCNTIRHFYHWLHYHKWKNLDKSLLVTSGTKIYTHKQYPQIIGNTKWYPFFSVSSYWNTDPGNKHWSREQTLIQGTNTDPGNKHKMVCSSQRLAKQNDLCTWTRSHDSKSKAHTTVLRAHTNPASYPISGMNMTYYNLCSLYMLC